MSLPDRRRFLAAAPALALLGAAPARPPRVAAVLTAFAHRWHAHVLLENFLEPYLFRGRMTEPGVSIVSMYADQFPKGDMARAVARDYGIPIFPTIAQALRLGGPDLDVDAVLLIGEHGDYPTNARGQKLYPRKEMFDAVAAEVRRAGRPVSVFCDKHLSHRWDDARGMADAARELKMPFWAGSSVPLAQRDPPLDFAAPPDIREIVSIHSGPFEMYDIHGLEVAQSLVEGRPGGERGVSQVQFFDERAMWDAAARGEWSPALADAAMRAEFPDAPTLRELLKRPAHAGPPHAIVARHRDGLTTTVLRVPGGPGTRWNVALRLADGTTRATRLRVGPWNNRCLFKALSHAIQVGFRDRRAPYPLERTLLTTGVLAAAVDSREAGGKPVETPHLAVAYASPDWSPLREDGASWKLLRDDAPETTGILKGGHRGI